MVRYFDSSILLAGILEQKPRDLVASLWDPSETRLASMLTKIECVIGVRRAGAMQGLPADGPWCRERIRLLDGYLNALECKRIDEDILGIVQDNASLANCRSLDAIHVATALYFAPHHDETIEVITLDARMRETAVAAGLVVLPSPTPRRRSTPASS